MRLAALAIITLLTLGSAASAQDAPPLKASIADAAWLSGRWTGEGMGGTFQQGMSDPAGGRIAGYFTLLHGDKAVFHQLILLTEQEGTLRLKVKHFSPDFVGWEEKDGFLDFPLISASPDELAFKAMTFRRTGADAMTLTIRMTGRDGTGRDEVLRYRRIP